MIRQIFLWIALFGLPYSAYAQADQPQPLYGTAFPKYEIRAAWLATIGGIDWPRNKVQNGRNIAAQKAELCRMLDALKRANVNAVVLQTRIRGTVIYPSKIEPWDDCLTGKYGVAPGYDPLAFAIEECHKRGMELHAWVVCIPIGKAQKQRAYGSQSIVRRKPGLCKTIGGEVFMQPHMAGTADHIAAICREIAENYDVDGISLDYIRYPEALYHYSDKCTPSQRRENINRIVKRVHDEVKAVSPWVKLSSSPVGKYRDLKRYSSKGWNCYDAVYQDPQLWLKEGWQDMLFPMMYFQRENFYPFLFDWQENSYGHPVAAGLGIYFLDPREGKWKLNDVRAQIHTARNAQIGGFVYYRSEYLVRNFKGIYDAACDELCPYPALMPAMTWGPHEEAPAQPAYLRFENGWLQWEDVAQNNRGNNYIYYNVYGSNVYPVDTDSPENLLLTRVKTAELNLSETLIPKRYYAVRACNRWGLESEARQEDDVLIFSDGMNKWNPTSRLGADGQRVDDRMKLLKQQGKQGKKKKRRK